MAVKAKIQQERAIVKEHSCLNVLIKGFVVISVIILLSNNPVHCREIQITNNHHRDNSNNNKHNIIDSGNNDKQIYLRPQMMELRDANQDAPLSDGTMISGQQRAPFVVKGTTIANPDLNNLEALIRRASVSQPSFLKRDLAVGNDHELPPNYYYYYQVQQGKPEPTFGGSVDFGQSVVNSDANNNLYQGSKSKTYNDFNTLVYPDGDQGNYDSEKRSDLGTTMSTLESYLPKSVPMRIKLFEMIGQNMNAANTNGYQVSKRSRGGSPCNFNSGLTSKCDNMDYLQAWNHHNWFHKTTLPGK